MGREQFRKAYGWVREVAIFVSLIAGVFVSIPVRGQSVIINPGFEDGTSPWQFYTNGAASFASDALGAGSLKAGHVSVTMEGSNVQLFQVALGLEPNTEYRLSFSAYSSTGHDISVSVHKHTSPYTSYGLDQFFDLTTSWNAYSVTFMSSGFSGTVNDARIQLWLAPYDANGDQYFFDDIVLSRTDTSSTAPTITSQPTNQTMTVGQTATFAAHATGSNPLVFQWQKDNANINGATGNTYTTPAVTAGDSGSIFRCIVSNSMGTVASNQAMLNVTTATVGGERGRVHIVNNTVVADNGTLLRGEHLLMTTWNADRIQNTTWYSYMSSRYHFNVVRLLCYRNPINVPGYVCDPSAQCMPVSSVIPLLDIAVEKARQAGLYAIIDYHPLGGYNEADAITWWTAVAPRYKNFTHVIYEISNEPNDSGDLSGYEQRMYNLVRGYAPNTHLIMWSFANGITALFDKVRSTTGISYSNASVGVHIYGTDWASVAVMRQTHPVFMTEAQSCNAGIPECQNSTGSYLADAAHFESLGMSWILLKSIPVSNAHPDLLANVNPIPWPIDPYFGTTAAPLMGQDTPSAFILAQNYPNPFNPSTEIRYQLPSMGSVTLKVFDVLGKEVATLVNELKQPGSYIAQWNASGVPSGVYFYRLHAGNYVATKKLVLLR